MKKVVLITSISVLGWLGWEISNRLGGGLMTSYLLSFVGSLVGVYVGVKVNRDYVE